MVQLRQDNALGTLWNMVGFQTKLKHGEQARIFRMIPGLATRRIRAAWRSPPQHLPQQPGAARPNSSPQGRSRACALPGRSRASRAMWNPQASGCSPGASPRPSVWARRVSPPPPTTALGALLTSHHRRPFERRGDGGARSFQPMNVNFGLFPPLAGRAVSGRRASAAARRSPASTRWPRRALADLDRWLGRAPPLAAE